MLLSPSPAGAAAAPAAPNQPTLPGLEPDVVARYAPSVGFGMVAPIEVRADRPIDAPRFTAFDDAVNAAREIMVGDRAAARWGLFKRHAGRVESIALLQVADGIRLARTTIAVDTYKEPVPGQMFPGQNWSRTGPSEVVRETPATLALVGADKLYDLRSGATAAPVAFPKR